MRFLVRCECVDGRVIADFPNETGAAELVRRHHAMTGHRPEVTRVLETPHEGLLS